MHRSKPGITWKWPQELASHTETRPANFPRPSKVKAPTPQHQLTNGCEEEPSLVNGGTALLLIVVDGDLGGESRVGTRDKGRSSQVIVKNKMNQTNKTQK